MLSIDKKGMKGYFTRLCVQEEGVAMTEYALIAFFVAGLSSVFFYLAVSLGELFTRIQYYTRLPFP